MRSPRRRIRNRKNNTVRVYHDANYTSEGLKDKSDGNFTYIYIYVCPYPKQLYNVCAARDTLGPMYKLNSTFPFIIYDRTSSSEYCECVFFCSSKNFSWFFLLIPSTVYTIYLRTARAALNRPWRTYICVKSLWERYIIIIRIMRTIVVVTDRVTLVA